MIKTAAPRLLAVISLLLGLLIFPLGAAHAAPGDAPHVPGEETSVGICAVQDTMGNSGSNTTALLPVNRWQEATVDFHSNLDEGFTKDVVEKAQRDGGMTGGMQLGNAAWATLTDATEFAVSFCAVDAVGGAVDQVAGAIGNAFLEYMEIIILALFIAVTVLLWRSFRNGRASWRPLVTKLAALLLLGITTAGATASTGGGIDGDTGAAYVPGAMSPGWIAQKTSTVIGEFTATPAGIIGYIGTEFETRGQDEATKSPLTSCTAYNNALRAQYKWIYSGKDEKAMSSAVPMIMSGMWEDTGLATWRASQFDSREFDEAVWCHLLDWSAGTPVGGPEGTNGHHTVWSIYKKANGGTEPQPWAMGSPAIRPGDRDAVSRSIMALTACQATGATDLDKTESWTVRSEFTPDTTNGWTDSKIKPEDCANWWSKEGNTQGAFKVPTDRNKIAEEVNNAALADYMNTVHGNTNKAGLITVPVYAGTSIVTAIVFGGMVIGVILASLALALVPVALPMVLLAIIFMPMANFSRLKKWFMSVIGLSIIISAVALILSLVTAMTSLLLLLASGMLGAAGSLISILFHTLAPIAAIWLLHLFFTKGLKAPSPFTLSGLTAWGSRVPGIGGAALGGAAAMMSHRGGQVKSLATTKQGRARVGSAASTFGRNFTGAGVNASRRGQVMNALGAGAAAAGGAAAGGAIGRRGSAAAKKGAGAVGAGVGAGVGAAAGQLGGKAGKSAGKKAGAVAATVAGDQALQAAMASSLFGAAAGSTAAAAAKELKPKSRSEQRAAFKAETAAAREHFGVERKSTSLGASLLRTPQNIKGSVHDTWKSFKSTPLQTTKALAAAGGTQAAVAGAGLVVGGLPALAAVGVAGGALYAANKYRQGKAEGKAMDATLAQAYRTERQAAEHQKAKEAKEAENKGKKKAAVGAPATGSGSEGSTGADGVWQSLHKDGAGPTEGRRGSVGESLPTAPVTSEMPVVDAASAAQRDALGPEGLSSLRDRQLDAVEQAMNSNDESAYDYWTQQLNEPLGADPLVFAAGAAAAGSNRTPRTKAGATGRAATPSGAAASATDSTFNGGSTPVTGPKSARRGGVEGGLPDQNRTRTKPTGAASGNEVPDQNRTRTSPTGASSDSTNGSTVLDQNRGSKTARQPDQHRDHANETGRAGKQQTVKPGAKPGSKTPGAKPGANASGQPAGQRPGRGAGKQPRTTPASKLNQGGGSTADTLSGSSTGTPKTLADPTAGRSTPRGSATRDRRR